MGFNNILTYRWNSNQVAIPDFMVLCRPEGIEIIFFLIKFD